MLPGEGKVRFGCGFLVGVVSAATGLLILADRSVEFAILAGLGAGLLAGLLALALGDSFWKWLEEILPW